MNIKEYFGSIEKDVKHAYEIANDAKKAGTKNLEKFPRNMLFARAMSNGVKWFTPDIFSGPVYVPEEMNVEVQDVVAEELPEAFMTEPEAIAAISECKSKDELTALYRSLSQSVRTLESVIAASKLKASEWN